MPVACGLLLSSRPLGTLQWSKGEIRIQSSGSSTQITTTSRCSGEIAEASVSKGITNLELPSIGWQLFILDSSQSDPIALPAFLDTYATRLLTEPLTTKSCLPASPGSSGFRPAILLRSTKVLRIEGFWLSDALSRQGFIRIVALEKVAGSSPVGHPSFAGKM